MFTGTYTAIVTPFKNGNIDEAALERLIKNQIKAGIDGVVPVGTTGESPTVDIEEHIQLIALSIKFAAGKIKVLAGTGANATSEAIHLTREAEKLGADGSLIELNRALSEKIAKGEVDLQTPGLAEHLWQTTMDKLAVDQPNYASYKRELGKS